MNGMDIQGFLSEVSDTYQTSAATEHSYRAALQNLLSSIEPEAKALNEPKRVKCGAPDFLVAHGDIVIGHVEAKDIPVGIKGVRWNKRTNVFRLDYHKYPGTAGQSRLQVHFRDEKRHYSVDPRDLFE
jgi:hypothetical protein